MIEAASALPILDTSLLLARGCDAEAAAGAMLESGAAILQIRHKGQWTREVYDQAGRIARMCEQARIPLIVQRPRRYCDAAWRGPARRSGDLPPAAARRLIGAAATLGYSTHNAEQLAAAAGSP